MEKFTRRLVNGRVWLLAAAAVLALVVTLAFGATPALTAGGSGVCSNDKTKSCSSSADCGGSTCYVPASGGDTLRNQGCMEDVAGRGLNCTANDVDLVSATSLTISKPCGFPGDTAIISFVAKFDLTTQDRYDVGVWIAEDGGNALTGKCSVSNFPKSPTPPWTNLDAGSQPTDTCGDINSTNDPSFSSIQNITVACVDSDGDGKADIRACMSWKQSGDNGVCTSPLQAVPGSPSKCGCEKVAGLDVPVPATGTIEVKKVLRPGNDTGTFNLQIDGTTKATGGNGATTGKVSVSAGTNTNPGASHNVQETAGTSTNLTDYTSSISCSSDKNGSKNGTGPGPLSITVAPNENWTCTITNERKLGSLKVTKVINWNGVTPSGNPTFNICVAGPSYTTPDCKSFIAGSLEQTWTNLLPGSYAVTEPNAGAEWAVQVSGSPANVVPDCANGCTAAVTVTNTRKPSLTLAKQVINDNGGTAAANAWTLAASGPTPLSGAGGVAKTYVNPGDYTLSETGGPAGYAAGDWSCQGGTLAGNKLTLTAGDAVCTISNNDIAPQLIVKKVVTNDNGGTKTAGDFKFQVNGGAETAFIVDPQDSSKGQNTLTPNAGSFDVTEPAVAGYAASYSGCSGTIALGETRTCTVTNDDTQPGLTVVKRVINDNGGTKTPADFTFQVNGGPAQAFNANGQNTLSVNAGTYSITEPAVAGYTTTYENCSNVVIATGGSATCTITNNDQGAYLTLVKQVINDNGGTAAANAWTLAAAGPTPLSGAGGVAKTPANPGAYTLSETGGVAGYAAGDWACVGGTLSGSQVTLALGDDATCTIINNDIQPKLVVIKKVTNDNGGTKNPGNFTINVTGNSASPASFPGADTPGTTVTLNAGSYSVGETAVGGYAPSYSTDCSGSIAVGETRTCTVTNDDLQPGLTVVKRVINDNGGTKTASDFSFQVNGGAAQAFNANGQNALSVNAGTYTITEPAVAGYTTTYENCSNVAIATGGSATCTITNNDQPATLIVKKVVINDNGGSKTAANFTFQVNGAAAQAFNANGENSLTVNAGTYSVTEPSVSGYATSYGNCSNLVIPNGGTATCTITNNDQVGPTPTPTRPPGGPESDLFCVKDSNGNWGLKSATKGTPEYEDIVNGEHATPQGGRCPANPTPPPAPTATPAPAPTQAPQVAAALPQPAPPAPTATPAPPAPTPEPPAVMGETPSPVPSRLPFTGEASEANGMPVLGIAASLLLIAAGTFMSTRRRPIAGRAKK